MTQEQQTSKNFFYLNGGLNTEFNELGFPEGYTTDEANYELLVDGSRRRRKGLAEESGGSSYTASTVDSDFNQTYLWRNVGGDPTLDIMVVRTGNDLHFAASGETLSSGWYTGKSIDMTNFESSGATTANTDRKPISFSHGRGRLLVSGQYIYPFYVEFDGSDFNATLIEIKKRDFSTIDDGTLVDSEPTGTLSADHQYNLYNRGWNKTDVTQFNTDLSKWPARNAIWHKGFKRTYGASVAELDGTRSWDSTKMDAEVFGNSSAPVGSLFLSPFDTSLGFTAGGSQWIDIASWTVTDTGADPWVVVLTTSTAHGISTGATIQVDGCPYRFFTLGGGFYDGTINGTHTTVATTSGTTITFEIGAPLGFSSWASRTAGQVDVAPLARSTGTAHTDSFRAVAWHAGRAFYGGMANSELADSIFYSQIVDSPEKYGKCYQEADPTDETFNALVATDGGEIVMPGLNGVVDMVSVRNSLLIFSTDGVWEISNDRSVFTADRYSVRKITDEGCSSGTSIVAIESAVLYTGPGGIYLIAPNQYTGILEAQNIIRETIQTKWNSITTTEQERCQAVYDDAQKKAYFLVKTSHTDSNATGSSYDEVLVFDSKISAWSRYIFSADGLLTLCTIPTADDPASNKKMKFLYESAVNTIKVADFDQTTFDDWDGSNGPLPYMYTSWDNLGDFQKRRQAPIVTVFSKRTETGYVDNTTGWDPTNYSSTLMSAYWDWTNDAISNKIQPYPSESSGQEVYRKVRDFAPENATDVDGYPVVVTRNKVRGRGRVLQLKFLGAEDQDSHLLGFTINYKVSKRK